MSRTTLSSTKSKSQSERALASVSAAAPLCPVQWRVLSSYGGMLILGPRIRPDFMMDEYESEATCSSSGSDVEVGLSGGSPVQHHPPCSCTLAASMGVKVVPRFPASMPAIDPLHSENRSFRAARGSTLQLLSESSGESSDEGIGGGEEEE